MLQWAKIIGAILNTILIMANFSDEKINSAWEKAKAVTGFDPNKYRQDSAGAWMQKDKYGKEENYGWEIDHKLPVSLGGEDDDINLQAMQWENNRTKNNDFPSFKTSITSNGNNYKREEQSWNFSESFVARLKQLYPNNTHLKKLAA